MYTDRTIASYIKSLNTTETNKSMLEILLKHDLDVARFKKIASDYSEKEIFFAICDFRIEKVDNSKITLSDFVEMFKFNPQMAMNELFMYPTEEQVVKFIHKKEISPYDIYKWHKRDKSVVPNRIVEHIARVMTEADKIEGVV